MLRKILAVIVGIVVAILIFTGFEYLGGKLYPMPAGIDPANNDEMTAFVKTLPVTALLLLLAGYVVGSFACGVMVGIVSKSRKKTPAYIAGLFLMSVGIVNVVMIPHPLWFTIINVLVYIPFCLLGHTVYQKNAYR